MINIIPTKQQHVSMPMLAFSSKQPHRVANLALAGSSFVVCSKTVIG